MKWWTLGLVVNSLTLTCWTLAGNWLLVFIYSIAVFSSGVLAWAEWVDKAPSERYGDGSTN